MALRIHTRRELEMHATTKRRWPKILLAIVLIWLAAVLVAAFFAVRVHPAVIEAVL
jgi:hypothetical protein